MGALESFDGKINAFSYKRPLFQSPWMARTNSWLLQTTNSLKTTILSRRYSGTHSWGGVFILPGLFAESQHKWTRSLSTTDYEMGTLGDGQSLESRPIHIFNSTGCPSHLLRSIVAIGTDLIKAFLHFEKYILNYIMTKWTRLQTQQHR